MEYPRDRHRGCIFGGKLNKPTFVEWLPGMIELGFLSEKKLKNTFSC